LAEARDDRRNINIVTRGGDKIGNDVVRKYLAQHQWAKKNDEPHKSFDGHNEKEILKQANQELLKKKIASRSTSQHTLEIPRYDMPPVLYHTKEAQP
jgi:hypothetical protein